MTFRSFLFLGAAFLATSRAFPCISNVSVEQSDFEVFALNWTNGCPEGTRLWLTVFYVPSPTFYNSTYFNINASDGFLNVRIFYLNSVNRLEIKRRDNESVVFSSTFTSLAAPPVISSSPFLHVGSRAVSLQWDSDTRDHGPIFKNPKGTLYEIQLSTMSSFDFPVVQTVTHGDFPDTATVGCLSPETRYYARVRAINRAGIPTDFLTLGSTFTLPAVPPSTVFSWGGGRWGLSLSAGEITGEDQIFYNDAPLESPLLSVSLPGQILAANSKLENTGDLRRRPLPQGLVEIQASRACPVKLDPTLEHPATLTYALSTGGDQVDTGVGLVRRDTLRFYRLDADAGVWNKIPSRIEGNKVAASVQELGTLAVMGQEDVSLQDLRVSPNPFHQGTDANVTFANLSERATLKLFTPSGREVRRLEETDGDGILLWDGKNGSGNSVEPGVYIYRVESPGAEKRGKVMVLR